jgi:hypothetical protein
MAAPQLAPLDADAHPACLAIAPGTFRMAKLLLPVDFSEPCSRVARSASMLARFFGSEVTVLHVQAADTEEGEHSGRLEAFERTSLEGLVSRFLNRFTNTRNHCILGSGYAASPCSGTFSK